ncbi:MAG: UMP kinase [Thermofilum sp.]
MPQAVVKVGGSLLFDEKGELRTEYLRSLIVTLKLASQNSRLVVVVGGGQVARKYIEAGRGLGASEGALDEVGIFASRLNASLLFAAFYKTFPIIPTSLREIRALTLSDLPVVFTGGLQPGQSTTTTAALIAEALSWDLVIATDVSGIFDKDPKKYPDAKLLKQVMASDLLSKFSSNQVAGGYKLLDPLTLHIIIRSKRTVRVIAGEPSENIARALSGENIGSVILPG